MSPGTTLSDQLKKKKYMRLSHLIRSEILTNHVIGRIYFGRRIIRLRRIMRLFKINTKTHKNVADEKIMTNLWRLR